VAIAVGAGTGLYCWKHHADLERSASWSSFTFGGPPGPRPELSGDRCTSALMLAQQGDVAAHRRDDACRITSPFTPPPPPPPPPPFNVDRDAVDEGTAPNFLRTSR